MWVTCAEVLLKTISQGIRESELFGEVMMQLRGATMAVGVQGDQAFNKHGLCHIAEILTKGFELGLCCIARWLHPGHKASRRDRRRRPGSRGSSSSPGLPFLSRNRPSFVISPASSDFQIARRKTFEPKADAFEPVPVTRYCRAGCSLQGGGVDAAKTLPSEQRTVRASCSRVHCAASKRVVSEVGGAKVADARFR